MGLPVHVIYQLNPNSPTYHNDGGLINITPMRHDRNNGRRHKKSINHVNDSIGCNDIFHIEMYSFFGEYHSSLRAKKGTKLISMLESIHFLYCLCYTGLQGTHTHTPIQYTTANLEMPISTTHVFGQGRRVEYPEDSPEACKNTGRRWEMNSQPQRCENVSCVWGLLHSIRHFYIKYCLYVISPSEYHYLIGGTL